MLAPRGFFFTKGKAQRDAIAVPFLLGGGGYEFKKFCFR
jgi:hypothetical protein